MKQKAIFHAALLAGSVFLNVSVWAAEAPSGPDVNDSQSPLARLPPEATVSQSTTFKGRVLKYRAGAGAIPVFDEAGRLIADVAYTSFILDSSQPISKRPVTFVVSGGPGASSGSLIFGLGPKWVQSGVQGDTPSTPIELTDNPRTWLEFTDLVFLDPVGTGFSRSYAAPDATVREFYGVEQDVRYLSGVIFDWLKTKQRLTSPKYLAGESYGGFRTPRMVEELTMWRGVGISGLILISPLLDAAVTPPGGDHPVTVSPMSFAVDLPTMAAAKYERDGKTLTPQLMHEVEEYSRGDYVTALLKGVSDPAGFDQMVKRVAAYTGMDEAKVRQLGGRLDQQVFVREVYRSRGIAGSRADINWTATDPFPWSHTPKNQDMVISVFAIMTSATTDFVTRVVGWKPTGRYWASNGMMPWEWGQNTESLSVLRRMLALDPNFKVLIAHGYNDFACPYMVSRLAVDQMPDDLKGDRVLLRMYSGGHIFYDREASGRAFMEDAATLYRNLEPVAR